MPSKGEEVLSYAGVYHLSFILSGKNQSADGRPIPIRCRRCGGIFTKTSHTRLYCSNKRKKCNNSCTFSALKAYLIDLYNHKIVSLSKGNDNIPLILFKNGRQVISLPFQNLFKPVPVKKLLTMVPSLRNHFWCKYDYCRPEMNDKEEIDVNQTLLSAEPTTSSNGTTLVIAAPTQDAAMKEANSGEELVGKTVSNPMITEEPILKPVIPSTTKEVDILSQERLFKKPVTEGTGKRKNNPLEEDERNPSIERYLSSCQNSAPKELNQFDLDEFNRLRTENAHLKNLCYNSKIEISNLTESIRSLEESWKKEKVKLSSQIFKAQNNSVALSTVLQNKEKGEDQKMIEEKKGKCKDITDSLEKNADHLPPQLQRIRSQEDGLPLIQESILSLIMRQPKIIRKDDLDLVYIKGIQRQPIWVIKKCLSNLGIRHFYIKNVSFIGKDICELTVLKRSKPMIINILKVFENSFKVLENFNPVAVDNASTANDEDILRVEKACYRRISETINRKRTSLNVEASTSGNNFAAPSSVCAHDNAPATINDAPANSPGSTSEVANAALRSSKEAISAFALALKERVVSPSKGFAAFKAANPSGPLESPEFKGTSELFEDDSLNTEDDNDSIISSTLTPTVPIEHYHEAGMDMYSDTIISNSPNILSTTINPLNPMDYSSEDIIESMKYINE
ncbi:hypothetical protein H8356DRAFT_1335264 [Neocallimastix lanati (nom. inval.)]|nr:hypothetical protein H8356DRAFT_1335264 [Neocallimastix sp. JGI-2020a]